jgi:hypothetical protein
MTSLEKINVKEEQIEDVHIGPNIEDLMQTKRIFILCNNNSYDATLEIRKSLL